jgi:hypothetical protein
VTKAELLERLAEAESKQAALMEEAVELAARIPDIRAAFGNPFSYSRPEHPDEGPANFTGYSSHAVGLPTFLELGRVAQRTRQLKADLAALDSRSE